MKIGIDASRAFQENRTGIEEYSYQVIKHLRKELQSEEVFLYIRKNQKADFDLPASWRVKIIKFPYLWTQIGLSLELLFHSVNFLFIPAHVVPIIHPKNTIVTIHGLEYEFCPEAYSFWERLYMRWSIKMSCRWAKKIISVSENTKNDLINLYKVNKDKIKVIYEGINQKSKIKNQNYNSKFKIKEPYLLFLGRLEKRKNIECMLDAYKILVEKYKLPHSLILAGKPGFGYKIIKLKIQNYLKIKNLKLKIVELGYIDEADKVGLIVNSDIFLFPTLYEGFGLPILEAQVSGVPVVTSNISSLPEVGGDSVIYVDPNSAESVSKGIYKLIIDQNFKDDIITKGYENVERFSWEKCAREIAKLF